MAEFSIFEFLAMAMLFFVICACCCGCGYMYYSASRKNLKYHFQYLVDRPKSLLRRTRRQISSTEEKKIASVQCNGCLMQMGSDRGGIVCHQWHHFCLDNGCTMEFINSQLADGIAAIPIRCPICKIEISHHVLARVMSIEQNECYMILIAMKHSLEGNINGDELVLFCPASDCKYLEYRLANANDVLFVHCQNPKCRKISCFTCKKFINDPNVGMKRLVDIASASSSAPEEDETFQYHIACNELHVYKDRFELLLEQGQGGECPECHLSGKKDYGDCCHMTCPRCETEWCYFCGESSEQLDIGDESFYRHFDDENSICPMYLDKLYSIVTGDDDVDDDDDDDERRQQRERIVDEYLSRLRTLKLLKKFKLNVGNETFQKLWQHFPMVRQCSYTLTQIDSIDLSAPLLASQQSTDSEMREQRVINEEEEAVVEDENTELVVVYVHQPG